MQSTLAPPTGLQSTLAEERQHSLVEAFRIKYYDLLGKVEEVLVEPTDSTVIARICDDLNAFTELVHQVSSY